MRAMLIAVALLTFSLVAIADDKEKRAKAAFAFQQQKVLDVKSDRAKELFSAQQPTADDCSHSNCNCHDTATCKCEPDHCAYCQTNLPPYPVQAKKALERGLVVVGYFGTDGKGTCFDGAISAAGGALQGHPPQTILIGYPHEGKLLISDELPATSKRSDIEAAIQKAKVKLGEKQPVTVQPATPAPVQSWFVAAPSPVVCRT